MKHPCAFSMAFVEFKDKALVASLLQRKQEVKIRDRVLIVDSAGESKHIKVNNENKKAKQKPAGTWNATSIAVSIFRLSCNSSLWTSQFEVIFTSFSSCSCPKQDAVFEQSGLYNVRKKPQQDVSYSC